MSVSAPRAVAHQFEDLDQQKDTIRLGMWVFLLTEVLFFGGLLTAYAMYRSVHAGAFVEGSALLDWKAGAINTAVLLTSSLTAALGVQSSARERHRRAAAFFGLTLILGAGFLGVKALEYGHKFHEGWMPFQGRAEGPVQLFLWLYLVMTGLHAVHVIIGLGLLGWLAARSMRRPSAAGLEDAAEVVGLYWHFVDVVWIFLFPLLYLAGRHG